MHTESIGGREMKSRLMSNEHKAFVHVFTEMWLTGSLSSGELGLVLSFW